MAQFYAEIQGNRGASSRPGSKQSGITGHIRGWHIGCEVVIVHENERDTVMVYRTGGSAGYDRELIAEFTADE